MENVLFYFIPLVCTLEVARARLDLTIDENACNNYYDLDDIKEAFVTYRGAPLRKEECYVKFTNWDAFQQTQCVKPVTLRTGCSTKVEYFRHFISEYLDPKKRFTCGSTDYDEWCGAVRTTNLFIVFRTSGSSTGDYVKLHIYRKDLPKDDDDWNSSDTSSTTSILIGVTIPVILVFVICGTLLCVAIYRRRRATQFPRNAIQYNVQTGAAPIQQPYVAPPMQPLNQPAQQQMAQGNYQWHPMQSAYPVSGQQSHTPLISGQPAQQQVPSAPSGDAPPPAYESVVK